MMAVNKHEAKFSLAFDQSLDEVWSKIGDPLNMSWHPGIESVSLVNEDKKGQVGAHRHLKVKGGLVVDEIVTLITPTSYSYKFHSEKPTPFPIGNYQSTIGVEAQDKGCIVHWNGSWTDIEGGMTQEEAEKAILGIYEGLQHVKESLSQ